MNPVGIDSIGAYTPHYALELSELALAHGLAPDAYTKSIGQHTMAVPAPDEDIISMAANAARDALQHCDKSQITSLLFATETGIDQSKAAGLYLHRLLELPKRCRVVELKQACHSGTTALHMALDQIRLKPTQKILLVMADVARYEHASPAQASQGAGAIALVLSANPRVITIEPETGLYTEDAMDFWRPNYRREAFVEGKLSCDLYLKALKEAWAHYHEQTKRDYTEFQHVCYHVPVPRLAEKAHQKLARYANQTRLSNDEAANEMHNALLFSRACGNTYTASLYMSLLSLLTNATENLSNHRIGFYSYGSGCIGEFFSGIVQANYKTCISNTFKTHLENREKLTHEQFKHFFDHSLPTDGSTHKNKNHKTGEFRFAGIDNHQRMYEVIDAA